MIWIEASTKTVEDRCNGESIECVCLRMRRTDPANVNMIHEKFFAELDRLVGLLVVRITDQVIVQKIGTLD